MLDLQKEVTRWTIMLQPFKYGSDPRAYNIMKDTESDEKSKKTTIYFKIETLTPNPGIEHEHHDTWLNEWMNDWMNSDWINVQHKILK